MAVATAEARAIAVKIAAERSTMLTATTALVVVMVAKMARTTAVTAAAMTMAAAMAAAVEMATAVVTVAAIVMAMPNAKAVLRAIALRNGGGSCNEDRCPNSRGEDDGNGGNGSGDNGGKGGGDGDSGGNGYSEGDGDGSGNSGRRTDGGIRCIGVLRAMALAIVVAAAAMKTAAPTVERRMTAMAPTALVMIALTAINIALFVTHHLVA
jgi:hypothetical protein